MALAPTDMAMLPSEAIFNGNRANWIWQIMAVWRSWQKGFLRWCAIVNVHLDSA
jgi:hypothetical protein